MAIGKHQGAKMLSDTWLTPPSILNSLGVFDLDPCCPIDMPWKTANSIYTPIENGLLTQWHGRVWLNPPYSKEATKWMEKMKRHNNGTALIFARTETSNFFENVWGSASGILFIKGRLHFHLLDGSRAKGNAGAPSCLIAYGDYDNNILKNCNIPGHYVNLKSNV